MKILLSVLTVLMMIIASRHLIAEERGQPLSISLHIEAENPRVGADLKIIVSIKNASGHDVSIIKSGARSQAELSFNFKVSEENGTILARTDYGESLERGRIIVSRRLLTLHPGEELTESTLINRLVKINHPGRYIIEAEPINPAISGIAADACIPIILSIGP